MPPVDTSFASALFTTSRGPRQRRRRLVDSREEAAGLRRDELVARARGGVRRRCLRCEVRAVEQPLQHLVAHRRVLRVALQYQSIL